MSYLDLSYLVLRHPRTHKYKFYFKLFRAKSDFRNKVSKCVDFKIRVGLVAPKVTRPRNRTIVDRRKFKAQLPAVKAATQSRREYVG